MARMACRSSLCYQGYGAPCPVYHPCHARSWHAMDRCQTHHLHYQTWAYLLERQSPQPPWIQVCHVVPCWACHHAAGMAFEDLSGRNLSMQRWKQKGERSTLHERGTSAAAWPLHGRSKHACTPKRWPVTEQKGHHFTCQVHWKLAHERELCPEAAWMHSRSEPAATVWCACSLQM